VGREARRRTDRHAGIEKRFAAGKIAIGGTNRDQSEQVGAHRFMNE
jgi:hypothetical protein